MSLSATHSGTTRRSGSGRSFGVGAAVLAVLIALGVVITVNQGSETTVSGPEAALAVRPNTDPVGELKRLNEMAARAAAATTAYVTVDPEQILSELNEMAARAGAATAAYVTVDPEQILSELNERAGSVAGAAEVHPGVNIEKTKIQNGQSADKAGGWSLESRLQHEFLDEQRDSRGSNGSASPLEGIAE